MMRAEHDRGRRGSYGVVVAALLFAAGAAAARPSGAIVQENARPGTRDWLLASIEPAPGESRDQRFQRRRAIEGYCSRTSVPAGEPIGIHVSTDPPSSYSLDVYRMGYYGGAGGRRVLSVVGLEGTVQPTPEDGPRNLIECRWEESYRWTVPADWLSGVYLGKLTADASGYQSYVVFIVRDAREAEYLFQCSDLTWQAYNRWPGWRSLYDWRGNRWHIEPGADVGFDRPYSLYYNGLPARWNALTNGSGEFLLWEFPLAFWMEKHGFDVTYISNLDTHSRPETLLRAKGFLSVGHDEYWSRAMLENVARARDAGVDLAFFCGNSLCFEVALRNSGAGEPDRVFGRVRPFPDEQELLGASSYAVGFGDWVCARPEHWIYEGTGLRAGDRIPDLVGWEFHGPPLATRPDLVVLAAAPVSRGGPEAVVGHAATIYGESSGAFVFNAGTCWWTLRLSSPPGFVDPPGFDFRGDDARVQRMTRNVLERMRR